MWTTTALVSFALVFQFGILVEGQTAKVNCGDHGNDMSIRIKDVPDLGKWTGKEAAWRLNDNPHSDCLPSFSIGASNVVAYGPFDAKNCTTLTTMRDYLLYEFEINADPEGSSPIRMYNHSCLIQCRYNRNGKVESSFIPRTGLGLDADVPEVVAYYPLNSDYGSREIKDRTDPGVPTGVELAPGPDGNDGMSYEFAGNSSSFIKIPNTDGELSATDDITITLWVHPGAENVTGPLFQYYNDTSGEPGLTVAIESLDTAIKFAPNGPNVTGGPSLKLDAKSWNFVGVSYDKSTGVVILSVNGTKKKLQSTPGMDLSTDFPVFLGSIGSGADHFEGRIARVRLFNEALTGEQLQNVRKFLDAGEIEITDLQFKMALYDADTYADEVLIKSTVPLEDTIYARVSIAHQFGISVDLLLDECYASTDQQGINNRYNLIQASCDAGIENTLKYNCSGQTEETEDFNFQAFRYPGQASPDIWLHCTVYACRTGNPRSRCQTQCTDCSDRKRRETGQFMDDTKYELTSGPYRFVDNEKAQTDTTEEREDHPSSNTRLVVIVLAVSGVVVAINIVVVVAVILIRRKCRQNNPGTETLDIRM